MKKFIVLIMTVALLVVMIAPLGVQAAASCPDLPADPVTAVWTTNNWQTSYFTITISGAGALNGAYDGYCVDLDSGTPVLTVPYSALLKCTYDPAAAVYVNFPENLDLVNYILNHYPTGVYTWADMQLAFWRLLENPTYVSDIPYDLTRVAELMADAMANGEGFMPGVGELCGVFVIPLGGPEGNRQISLIAIPVPPEEEGDEGCTPGFWKGNADNKGASAWVGYAPGGDFNVIFGIPEQTLRANGKKTYINPTLRDALDANGSGINLLARSAVAALLNAANPDVDYPRTEADIFTDVQAAIAAGPEAIQTLGEQLDYDNNLGCPIDQQWAID